MECPRFSDIIDTWDDGIKLAHYSVKDCILFSRMVDPVQWQRGYDSIVREFVGEKAITRVYQFGSKYTAG
ncbi:MAG: hypothetical protein JRI34_02760 [Deltaproteobacteria bacterium]|nr:hypothetical protein [Deltaproteobacteria bacterium]